jgi:hypothetical protein
MRAGRMVQPKQAVLVPLTERGSVPADAGALVAVAGD